MGKLKNILITNDDGFDAIGLKVLRNIASQIAETVWVAAPDQEQSAASRKVSIYQDIKAINVTATEFRITGSPADCVIIALEKLMPQKPDLILSGVNCGHNASDFIHISGTFAAAAMGTNYGVPSMALSLLGKKIVQHELNWQMVESRAPKIIQKAYDAGLSAQNTLNINFPNCAENEVSGIKILPQSKRSDAYIIVDDAKISDPDNLVFNISFKGLVEETESNAEVDALLYHYILLTSLNSDLTSKDDNQKLKKAFNIEV